uniref:Uncharacterized protein n=1 Tax=Meloidogyne incognita TaxID=6306 RepID=A0A914NQ43_MELIC
MRKRLFLKSGTEPEPIEATRHLSCSSKVIYINYIFANNPLSQFVYKLRITGMNTRNKQNSFNNPILPATEGRVCANAEITEEIGKA